MLVRRSLRAPAPWHPGSLVLAASGFGSGPAAEG
jgi:hypothetical protein